MSGIVFKNGFFGYELEDYNQTSEGLPPYGAKYYVTQDGYAITEPMTAGDIVAKFGPIRELEANGFRVVPA